jgi:hypothetical protein
MNLNNCNRRFKTIHHKHGTVKLTRTQDIVYEEFPFEEDWRSMHACSEMYRCKTDV